jgi:hypothetical protein
MAGMDSLMAKVVEATDREVLEIQLQENGNRQDPNFMDEAVGYYLLHTAHGQSAAGIAKEQGKPATYVSTLLRVAKLNPQAKKACYEGKLTLGVASDLARLSNDDIRTEATEALLKQYEGDPEPITARKASVVLRRYSLRLDRAPFDTADPKLCPGAGSCANCPKRSGNQSSLPLLGVAEISADICTDRKCYDKKVEAQFAVLREASEEKGIEVLDIEASAHFYASGPGDEVRSPTHADLDAACDFIEAVEGQPSKTWRDLFTAHLNRDTIPDYKLTRDTNGGGHYVFSKADAIHALAKAGVEWAVSFLKKKEEKLAAKAAATATPEGSITVTDNTKKPVGRVEAMEPEDAAEASVGDAPSSYLPPAPAFFDATLEADVRMQVEEPPESMDGLSPLARVCCEVVAAQFGMSGNYTLAMLFSEALNRAARNEEGSKCIRSVVAMVADRPEKPKKPQESPKVFKKGAPPPKKAPEKAKAPAKGSKKGK